MKRIVIFITLQLTLFMGQFAMVHSLNAQPAPVKQAAKSVFTLTTFRADGSLLASSHGVFIGNQGEALSDLTPFLGARRAVVVDANGKQMNVERILGVNDMYDMCRYVLMESPISPPAPAERRVRWPDPLNRNEGMKK